jgi:hypothetical protein
MHGGTTSEINYALSEADGMRADHMTAGMPVTVLLPQLEVIMTVSYYQCEERNPQCPSLQRSVGKIGRDDTRIKHADVMLEPRKCPLLTWLMRAPTRSSCYKPMGVCYWLHHIYLHKNMSRLWL